MGILGPKSIYRLLALLVALVVAGGLLLLLMAETPNAQETQEAPTTQGGPPLPSINKECTPDPVPLGQQVTCTIDVVAAPHTGAAFQVTDTLPSNLTVIDPKEDIVSELLLSELPPVGEPLPLSLGACDVVGNTVTCPSSSSVVDQILNDGRSVISYRLTIKATAEQCGTAENTATADEGVVFSTDNTDAGVFVGPDAIQDTESITVACGGEGSGQGGGPGQEGGPEQGGGAEQGGGPGQGREQGQGHRGVEAPGGPITQESEQDSESGEVDQSYEVS